jgi:hypothetical protein
MDHDFVKHPSNPRFSSTGAACTNVDGFMDYGDIISHNKWSPCSVEDFNAYFNKNGGLTGRFCLAANNGNNTHLKIRKVQKKSLKKWEKIGKKSNQKVLKINLI